MASAEESIFQDSGLLAWDPKCPVLLLRVAEDDDDNDNNDKRLIKVHMDYSAGPGVGCNKYESSAIMALLDARDEYLQNTGAIGSYPAMQNVCQKYCQVLSKCNEEWSEALRASENDMEIDEEVQKSSLNHEALELLTVVHALTQLSATYLLLPNNKRGLFAGGTSLFNHFADMVRMDGAATADTVRFLRRHCLGSVDQEFDESDLQELEKVMQPDQWNGGDLYWALVEGAMIRGCLDYAWALLSNHSCNKALNEYEKNKDGSLDEFRIAAYEEDKKGFEALEAILLSAPLPGGRNDDDDFDFGQNSLPYDSSFDGEMYIQGIKASAYRYWDVNPSLRGPRDSEDHFEPREAYALWKEWQEAIESNPDLKKIRSRIPQLNKLLDMLCGKFGDIQFNSWQEELCAGLLYQTPNIKMDDMYARTARIMENHQESGFGTLADGIVKVMKGNAGEVMALASGLGGSTAAALPAVMMSLLSKLFSDAQALRENETERYTIHAASAIRSSFAAEAEDAAKDPHRPSDQRDLGSWLTVKLLLPYIKVGSSLTYTAALVDTLEHHSPQSDPEAEKLLLLCQKLVERKNVRVLDGCDSICLARYLHYKASGSPAGAIKWLIRGAELESLLFCGSQRTGAWQTLLHPGVCFRKLVVEFSETAQSMLKYLLGEEVDGSASETYRRAKEMIEAQQESSITPFVAAVKVLEHIVTMAQAISEHPKTCTTVVASNIVECLEEYCNEEDDGAVSSLAPPCMQWDLLRLSTLMLERDAAKGDMEATASFDVKGMGVLFSCFMINVENMKMTKQLGMISSENIYKMRLALGEGLKRAFIVENAMKAAPQKKTARLSTEGVYAANFDEHAREVGELAVKNMLDGY
ncbi:Nup85 nucleoporin [Nitzschia inconspicua]|uniref:Nuclear pore complex protein Nup85 n=1 Tax=Nitzschia inconspicua TaxID=303405 RepID=A0A9K3PUC2_9STRA|nr:Nup85 nucleoporin [Nitzschia inconspicua]